MKQLKTSEDEFVTVGRPKQEAQEVYQKRVGKLAEMAEKDTNFMVDLVGFCGQKYPL